ncbi:hypothetical protein T05_11840 [Trichinella murrelli]|uniref:Uncharacterized protein n=1 Tax=Trichinella murrelli TaxID=144512 RepID=A0A0V0T3R3_9BILA|nr:hypothetical protein T05_5264 [Trichinella murrelli]KRX33445.1 hypothetical protein T05_10796 [Trichinella murrelli]KRX33661.1 hypothetical protein T05_11840 [Trichinella murrelli]
MHGSALFPRDRDIHNVRSAVFDQYKVRLVYATPDLMAVSKCTANISSSLGPQQDLQSCYVSG